MSEPLLTAREVAELLKLNIETIYTLIGKGELPAIKLGGQWRFDESELTAWLKERSRSNTKTASATGGH